MGGHPLGWPLFSAASTFSTDEIRISKGWPPLGMLLVLVLQPEFDA